VLQPFAIGLGVAELEEVRVAFVRAEQATCMLDRAPVLLGARGDLAAVRGNAVAVRAVGSVQPLDQVQLGQLGAVEHQVVAPKHARDAVQREKKAAGTW
jgi:hypothetical protein